MALETVNNLSSILFYSGEYSKQAASETEARNYGAYVTGLGTLTKTSDSLLTWSEYPNVVFEETTPEFNKLGDIYEVAYSYAKKYIDDYSFGTTYIADNKYNAIYTYEIDLNNDFAKANIVAKNDLKNFVLAMNRQIFNKQKYYGDDYEINSLRIGPTTFNWYPENTVAYTWSYDTPYEAWSYSWASEAVTEDVYNTNIVPDTDGNYSYDMIHSYYMVEGTMIDPVYTYYTVSYSYSYTAYNTHFVDYVIGGDYYSYTRQTYNTIDDTLESTIKSSLDAFEEKYNHNASMYAYYIYDCNADVQMTVDSKSAGTKKSTFQIGFDSEYSKWFTYNIAIHADVNSATAESANITTFEDAEEGYDVEDTTTSAPTAESNELTYNLIKIASADDNAIFDVRLNENTQIAEANTILNKDEYHTFRCNEISADDVISILTPHKLKVLDLSPLKSAITGELNITASNWNTVKGCKLEQFIMDNGDDETKCDKLTKITGLNELKTLKYINISNCSGLERTPAISSLDNLKVYCAKGSSITNFKPAQGAKFNHVCLPNDSIKLIKLIGVSFEAGKLNVDGTEVNYSGDFDYTPNAKLQSLTLNDVSGIDTYKFVKNWYNALKNASLIDSVIYLDLKGFEWNAVPVDFLLDIRNFDINQINGSMFIKGTGNYKWLSRTDYQNIRKAYGINAFAPSTNTENKVYTELLLSYNHKETFEYSLSVENLTLIAANAAAKEAYDAMDDDAKQDYRLEHADDPVYDTKLNVTIEDTRAGNAFLDLLPNESMKFVSSPIDRYAYCKLNASIDTKDSDEIKNVTAGDIMLYNGDTIVIFFESFTNDVYEYVKIGHIDDTTIKAGFDTTTSLIGWLSKNDSELHFIPATRPVVVEDISISGKNYVFDGGPDDTELEITVDVDKHDAENLDIVFTYDKALFSLSEVVDGETTETPSTDEPEETDGTTTVAATTEGLTYPRKFIIKPLVTIDNEKQEASLFVASAANTVDTITEYKFNILQYNEPAVVDENNILQVNNSWYRVENGILVVKKTAASYDEETSTITLE